MSNPTQLTEVIDSISSGEVSARQLADESGCHHSTISKWVSGETLPNIQSLTQAHLALLKIRRRLARTSNQ